MALACLVPAAEGAASGESRAGKSNYQFKVPSSLVIGKGSVQELAIAIVPNAGFRVAGDGPLRIDFHLPSTGELAIKKKRLSRRDAGNKTGEAPRFQVPVRGQSAGLVTLVIHYRFWLCRAKICWPIRGKTSVEVEVQAPPPSAGKGGDAGPPDAGSK